MTTSKRDPEATRAAILDAAEEVFLETGFANASTSKIAERAEVTKSLIHHHFGSKEALWREVKYRRLNDYFQKQLEMIDSSDPNMELLRQSFEFYFRFLQDNPQVVRIMAWMYLEQDEDCSDLDDQLNKVSVEKIREAQQRGEIRSDVAPESVLFSFVAVLQHWFQAREHFCRHLGPGTSMEQMDDAYFRDVMKIYFDGITAR